MTVGDAAPQVATFKLVNDPRTTATAADLQAQFDFLIQVRDRTTAANDAVKTIGTCGCSCRSGWRRRRGCGARRPAIDSAMSRGWRGRSIR